MTLNYKNKRQVTVVPSSVPSYASACSGTSRYSSACSCWGITATTSTAPAPTVTEYVHKRKLPWLFSYVCSTAENSRADPHSLRRCQSPHRPQELRNLWQRVPQRCLQQRSLHLPYLPGLRLRCILQLWSRRRMLLRYHHRRRWLLHAQYPLRWATDLQQRFGVWTECCVRGQHLLRCQCLSFDHSLRRRRATTSSSLV